MERPALIDLASGFHKDKEREKKFLESLTQEELRAYVYGIIRGGSRGINPTLFEACKEKGLVDLLPEIKRIGELFAAHAVNRGELLKRALECYEEFQEYPEEALALTEQEEYERLSGRQTRKLTLSDEELIAMAEGQERLEFPEEEIIKVLDKASESDECLEFLVLGVILAHSGFNLGDYLRKNDKNELAYKLVKREL